MVDVVLFQSFVWRKGQARPYDGRRIKRGDEEGEGGGGDVVEEMAVRQITAREVEKMTTLSKWCTSAGTLASAIGYPDLKGCGSSLSSIIRVFCPWRYILAGRSSLTVSFRCAATFAQWVFAGYLPCKIESWRVILVE